MKRKIVSSITALYFAICCCFTVCVVYNAVSCANNTELNDAYGYERFSVNAPDMSSDELDEYYEKNGISPQMPDGVESGLNNRVAVTDYLSRRFPDYQWQAPDTEDYNELSDRYGNNPRNTYEAETWLDDAKKDSNLPSTKEYVGCGAIAMMEAFNYLSETLDYIALRKYPINNVSSENVNNNRYEIAKDVIAETPSTGWWGYGTSIMPNSFLIGARNVLQKHDLFNTSGDYSAIDVYGDTISRNETKNQKIETVKAAIDRGTQVIWWTGVDFGDYSSHYMNIIGYAEWTGLDSNGNQTTHTFLLVNCNWQGRGSEFIDTDFFSAPTMGFIFIEPKIGNVRIAQKYLNVPEQYNNSAVENSFIYQNGSDLHTERLRMAYIKHYTANNSVCNGKYLALSPNKTGAGVAYFLAGSPARIKKIHIDVSWWRVQDRYTSSDGELKLQVMNPDNGEWITVFDFLNSGIIPISVDLNNPTKLQIGVGNGSMFFRIIATYNNPTSTRNSGRFIIHGINVLCD